MKKTVITKTIDGHKIITGFDRATFDPMSTRAAANIELDKTDEAAAVDDAAANVRRLDVKIASGQTVATADYDAALATVKNASLALFQKKKDLLLENAIYFEPRAGEYIVDDAEFDALKKRFKAERPGEKALYEKSETIDDMRGVEVFEKKAGRWMRKTIVKLGEVPNAGAKKLAELSSEERADMDKQAKKDEIDGLSAEDREARKLAAIAGARTGAAINAIEFELDGDEPADAMLKARELFNLKKDEIEVEFAISEVDANQ